MKIKLVIALIAAGMLLPLYSQDKKTTPDNKENIKKEVKEEATEKKEAKKAGPAIFQEIMLEDFEINPYTDKNVSFASSGYQQARISIRDQFPAPTGSSKKYLGIKVFAKNNDAFIIKPAKEIVIDKYCKYINFWVYGKNLQGDLSFLILDGDEQTHKIKICNLDFMGWKKIQVALPASVAQQDEFITQRKAIKILQIQYHATVMSQTTRWQFFYLDDITAMVREKYNDKQSDEW